MITFPWIRGDRIDPARKYAALVGLAELRSITVLPTFLYYGALIDGQLRRSPGMMGYRTAMEVTRLRFYHLSTWADRKALHAFIRTDPHRRAMDTLEGWLGTATFTYFEVSGSELPLDLSRELFRLAPNTPGQVVRTVSPAYSRRNTS
jgi:hypothetical protein